MLNVLYFSLVKVSVLHFKTIIFNDMISFSAIIFISEWYVKIRIGIVLSKMASIAVLLETKKAINSFRVVIYFSFFFNLPLISQFLWIISYVLLGDPQGYCKQKCVTFGKVDYIPGCYKWLSLSINRKSHGEQHLR